MKQLLPAALALVLLPLVALADPIEGIWQTESQGGSYAHIAFGPCGAKICGTIMRTFNASGEYLSDDKGKPMVRDMVPDGSGGYSGGQIWEPSTGKTYQAKMTLSGSTLNVSACIGPICKKQTWRKTN